LALCRPCYNAYATAKADQARREAGVPKRGKATVCRTPACGKPRDINCEFALCSDCYRARERNKRRAQRGTMPHQFRFGVERRKKPGRKAAVKPVAQALPPRQDPQRRHRRGTGCEMSTRAVGQMTEMYENDVKRLNQRVAQLEAELAAEKGDSERLTRIIDQSLNGEDWFNDGVWDRASDFYEDDENPQQAIRAAIDAMRGPQ
jgi:hypothetical protein